MLKSTHRAAGPPSTESQLPQGWTEHKAPSGHLYYYNASTKQSTYTRPMPPAEQPLQVDYNATQPENSIFPSHHGSNPFSASSNGARGQGVFTGGRSYQERSGSRSQHQHDRPKSKKPILNCKPWVLVMTKKKRRFVWNSDTNESFWKFPQDVMLAVIEMERVERERGTSREVTEEGVGRDHAMKDSPATAGPRPQQLASGTKVFDEGDSDDYEEVEVTDDEDKEDPEDPGSKRPRISEDAPTGPVEFNEDDIAYQLAQMGEDYGLDRGEFDNPDMDEEYVDGEEGLTLTEEDSKALFCDLLDDYKINPFTTLDKLVEDGHIINDDRYTVLPNMGKRREVFTEWSTHRIQQAQARRTAEQNEKAKRNPRVAYLRFLHTHASLKLYWPEFRRKFKKEDQMREPSYPDKEREKLYREFTARLKMSESDRKEDLIKLLRAAASTGQVHNLTSPDTLPDEVLRDVKFHALPGDLRDETVLGYCSTLAPPSHDRDVSNESEADLGKQREERRRREDALADRQRRVEEEKRKAMGAVRHGRELMREGAEELERAKRVGRQGLMGYIDAEQ